MKIYKRMVSCILLAVLTVFYLLPVSAAEKIDLNCPVSLTISFHEKDTALKEAVFDIYLVAAADENGNLSITDSFSKYPVDITCKNEEAWNASASVLEGYAIRDSLSPTETGKTDENGNVNFPCVSGTLRPGLYLVSGHRLVQSGYYYDVSPFLVMLPGMDKESSSYLYHVTANPKHSSGPVPGEPDKITRKVLKVWKDDGHEKERPEDITVQLLKDSKVFDTVTLNAENDWRHTWQELDGHSRWTVVEKERKDYTVSVEQEGITFVVTNCYSGNRNSSDDSGTQAAHGNSAASKLPQTGQLWWPVPVLISAGLLLIVIGIIRRRRNS